MQTREGVQKGPQDHAEGQHGSKTHSKIIEQLQSGHVVTNNGQNGADSAKTSSNHSAAHRLVQDRQQHDAAEKRSEKTRLNRAIERHELGPGPE
jgi:hypothetical protein